MYVYTHTHMPEPSSASAAAQLSPRQVNPVTSLVKVLPEAALSARCKQRLLSFKGPCTHIAYTLAPKYLYRDYVTAKLYAIWVHGPLGVVNDLQPASEF